MVKKQACLVSGLSVKDGEMSLISFQNFLHKRGGMVFLSFEGIAKKNFKCKNCHNLFSQFVGQSRSNKKLQRKK